MKMKNIKKTKYKRIDELTIKTDRLELLLKDFTEKIKKKDDWIAWLGILVSLCPTYFFSEFKDIAFLKATDVKMVYGTIIILCSIMLIKSIFTRVKIWGKDNVEYIVDTILAESKTPYEFRLLYIIKRGLMENAKILVFYDKLYECYMLPHIKNEAISISDQLIKIKMSEYIQVPVSAIRIKHYNNLEKISEKFSEYHARKTVYNFSFCSVIINSTSVPTYLRQHEFDVNGRTFKWMSLSELDQHDNTRQKNGDVVRFIQDNTAEFFSVPNAFEEIKNNG